MTIRLRDLIQSYSHIRLATTEDNAEILEFLERVDMQSGGLQIRYDRSPDYFAFLREQGLEGIVFLFLNDDRSIGGMGTFVLRDQLVAGQVVRTCYLCDLRTAPSLGRKARVQWRQLYTDVVAHYHETEEFGQCAYFYSAILDQNKRASHALVSSRNRFIYRKVSEYESVQVLGRLPFSRKFERIAEGMQIPFRKQIPLRLRHASAQDCGALVEFLQTQNQRMILGDAISTEFERRLGAWANFDVSHFLLIEDSKGRIRACVCPWQDPARKLVLSGLSGGFKTLARSLPFIGGQPVVEGRGLKVLQLTHFFVDPHLLPHERNSCFLRLLSACYRICEMKEMNMLAFSRIPGVPDKRILLQAGYVSLRSRGNFYQILSPEDEQKEHFLPVPTKAHPLHFELGLA